MNALLPLPQKDLQRINRAIVSITARDAAIHRLNYAAFGPEKSDRDTPRAISLMLGLLQTHLDDPIALNAIDKALSKLERSTTDIFNRNIKTVYERRINACEQLLINLALQDLMDTRAAHIVEKHLIRSYSSYVRTQLNYKGNIIPALQHLLHPQIDEENIALFQTMKQPNQRVVMAILKSLKNTDDITMAKLYLENDAHQTLSINYPDLKAQVTTWIQTPQTPKPTPASILKRLKSLVPQ